MIKVRLKTHLMDPAGRVSNLLALVFRELSHEKKQSTVLEVDCGEKVEPLRLQLRVINRRISTGASRPKRRLAMTRKT